MISSILLNKNNCPVGWGCRIHQRHICRGVRHPQWVSWYDTKRSDGKAQVMLWGMRSIPSLPLLPDPLWPRMVASDRALSIGWIELDCILMLNWIVWIITVWLNWIAWNRNVFGSSTVYLYLNWVFIRNWIVWNRSVFDIETLLTLNWIVMFKTVF